MLPEEDDILVFRVRELERLAKAMGYRAIEASAVCHKAVKALAGEKLGLEDWLSRIVGYSPVGCSESVKLSKPALVVVANPEAGGVAMAVSGAESLIVREGWSVSLFLAGPMTAATYPGSDRPFMECFMRRYGWFKVTGGGTSCLKVFTPNNVWFVGEVVAKVLARDK